MSSEGELLRKIVYTARAAASDLLFIAAEMPNSDQPGLLEAKIASAKQFLESLVACDSLDEDDSMLRAMLEEGAQKQFKGSDKEELAREKDAEKKRMKQLFTLSGKLLDMLRSDEPSLELSQLLPVVQLFQDRARHFEESYRQTYPGHFPKPVERKPVR